MVKNILYVIHSGTTGGTFNTNKDLMKNIEKKYNVFLLTAESKHLILHKFKNNSLKTIKKFSRNFDWSAKTIHDSWLTYIYYEILTEYHIDLVHIRHLIYHSFDLPQIAKKLNIPTVISFHDFYFICPNYMLLNEKNIYCKGICSNNEKNCYLPWNIFDDIHFKTILPLWREEVKKMFEYVDIFVTTSQIVKDLFLSIYPNETVINDNNFKVIEHGRDFPKIDKKLYEVPSEEKPLKIICPANNLNKTKGLDVIKNIKKIDKDSHIEFHFLGNCTENMESLGISHGTYERDEFYKKVEKINPSFIGVFSIWPETFCHTITESWSCGIPVIGTNIGVIEDRIIRNNGGFTINLSNFKESYKNIIYYKTNPQNYLKLINNVSKIQLKTTPEMSEKYLEIYDELLNELLREN